MKKKIIILIALIIILASLLVTLFFLVNKKSSDTDAAKTSNISESCQEFLDAYCSLDSEKAGEMLTGLGEPMKYNQLTELLAQNMTYEVVEVLDLEETTATVKVKIENVDINVVLDSLPDSIESEEDAQSYLYEAFFDKNVPKKIFNVDVKMLYDDEFGWRIDMDESLANAILGGLYSTVDEKLQEEE